MTAEPIFTDFAPNHAEVWGQAPLRLGHRLHTSPLFSNEALAELIDRYPRTGYSLVQWKSHEARSKWREGEIGDLSGKEVIEAIAAGRIWINLRNVPTIDKRYQALLDQIFAELQGHMPDFETMTRTQGILISSPLSRTLYHCDLPGQSLWQIRGTKRVYVYPKAAPFVRAEHIEGIALSGVEVSMPYQPWFDDYATVYDLEPGQMLHWGLNAPHRVDNHDCLNVSMTVEFFTPAIRRHHMVTVANAILRSKFGVAPKSQAIEGPAFWSKALLQKGLRETAWIKRADRSKRPADFRLDRQRLGAIVDLPAYAG